MKKPGWIQPNNPVRAWSRRTVLGLRNRPDVQMIQLRRRIEIMERRSGIVEDSKAWIGRFIEALTPYQFLEFPLERLGSTHDGGYVLPSPDVCKLSGVLSIGVGDNNDVDVVLAESGLQVHAWDHTVSKLPREDSRITFHQVGLGNQGSPSHLLSFDEIVVESFGKDSSGLLLLLDAEGAEWQALSSCEASALERFDVIAIEFHELGDLLIDPDMKLSVLERLGRYFAPVAIHGNNHSAEWKLDDLTLPDALEVTYVRRTLLSSQGKVGNCSKKLFSPCCPDLPEVDVSWAPAS